MGLRVKPVNSGFIDLPLLERLNNEAFPEQERTPMQAMAKLADDKSIDLWAMYDEDTFVGFFAMIVNKPCAYVFSLAIDGSQRSKGYGKQSLLLVRELYSEYQVMLDVQPIDTDAPYYEQRVARKQFYLQNGYSESGYGLNFMGEPFEVLYSGSGFNKQGLIDLLNKAQPELNKYAATSFETTLFKI